MQRPWDEVEFEALGGTEEKPPQSRVIGEVRQLGKGKILLTLLNQQRKYIIGMLLMVVKASK